MSNLPSLAESQQTFLLAALSGHELEHCNVSPKKRLAVYQQNHQGALSSSLRDTYKLTSTLLGRHQFDKLSTLYIQCNPSNHENLNLYGAYFSEFLENNQQSNVLVDLANYEYKRIVCYYASNRLEFPIKQFESMTLESKLAQGFMKQASVLAIKCRFDLLAFLNDEKTPEEGIECFYAMYREEGKPKLMPITHGAYDLLNTFEKPQTLESLSEGELILLPESIAQNWLMMTESAP